MTLNLFKANIILFEPIVELYEVGYCLGKIHKLTIPRDMLRVGEKLFQSLFFHEIREWSGI